MWSAVRSVGARGFLLRVGAFVFLFVALTPQTAIRASADDFGFPLWQLDGVDAWFGGGTLPSATLQSHFGELGPGRSLVDWLSILVYVSWLPSGIFVMWYVVRVRWDQYWSFAGSWFAVWYLSLVGFILLPAEPPWMIAGLGVERTLAEHITELVNVDPNQVAAFPSLHVAMPATLAFQSAASKMRWMSRALFLFSVVTALAVVQLGEHYVIDTLAGFALAWVAVGVSARLRSLAGASVGHSEPVDEQRESVDEQRLAA